MQSGITASQELQQAFSSLLSDPSQRAIVAGISSSPESLVPLQTLPSASPDFKADLAVLDAHLAQDAAAYIILRESSRDASSRCVAVTYVPDEAPVRQKMLFASTRLTLVRELGTEHFSSTLFATTKDELAPEGWAKHEAHGSLSAPLTEEERSLEGIKNAEAEESMGTGARKGGHISGGGIKVSLPPDAVEALKKLAHGGELGLVQLRIDIQTESILLSSAQPPDSCSPATLHQFIPFSSPRYSFYAHENAAPSGRSIVFIYTCPSGSSIKERMLYASFSRSITTSAEEEAGVVISRRMETSGPEDITEQAIREAVHPTSTSKPASGASGSSVSGFSKPKRPGRR